MKTNPSIIHARPRYFASDARNWHRLPVEGSFAHEAGQRRTGTLGPWLLLAALILIVLRVAS